MLSHKVYTAENYKENSLKKNERMKIKKSVKTLILKCFKEWTHFFMKKLIKKLGRSSP